MDTTQAQLEPEDEMSSQQEVSRDFNTHGHSGALYKTSGQGTADFKTIYCSFWPISYFCYTTIDSILSQTNTVCQPVT